MKKRQTGVAAVEFALVLVVFLTVILGIFDFGLVLFRWNAVAEATRWGARQAVVCDKGAPTVLANMQQIVPDLTSANVKIDWYDQNGNISSACTFANCSGVAVSVTGLSINPISPVAWIGFSSLPVPGFSTYLPREVMGQDPDSGIVCN